MTYNVVWCTKEADSLLAYMARVSNPAATLADPNEKLISYLLRKRHWSPFDMVNMCVEISTSRDISRQIMRHWSLLFHDLKVQEFSQRYSAVTTLGEPILHEVRLQDSKNRQSSLQTDDEQLKQWWATNQLRVWDTATVVYERALAAGVAKEQARSVLPEGLTPTKFYLNGTARQWIHYLEVRRDPGTQKEHREVAEAIWQLFYAWAPETARAVASVRATRAEALQAVNELLEINEAELDADLDLDFIKTRLVKIKEALA